MTGIPKVGDLRIDGKSVGKSETYRASAVKDLALNLNATEGWLN
jgi:hypothetical protein